MRDRNKTRSCGTCKHWIRREGSWGNCHRNAPMPYVLGPAEGTYVIDWQKNLSSHRQEQNKGLTPDWAPPNNWRVLWPDTNATDICGQWITYSLLALIARCNLTTG